MWTPWRRRSRRTPRLAPAGARAPQTHSNRPPDGWEALDPPVTERIRTRADTLLFAATDAAARVVSRREFLRRSGQVALVVGVAASGVLFVPGYAKADFHCTTCNCQDPNNQTPGPCGTSPICTNSHCINNNCDTTQGVIQRRANSSGHWPGLNCASNTADNCWTEPCPTGCKRCCDCCTGDNATPHCSSCSSTKHRCICRSNWTNCG